MKGDTGSMAYMVSGSGVQAQAVFQFSPGGFADGGYEEPQKAPHKDHRPSNSGVWSYMFKV